MLKIKKRFIILIIIIVILVSSLLLIALNKINQTIYTFPVYSKNVVLEGIEIESIIEYDKSYIAVHYPIIESKKINDIIYKMVTKKLADFKEKINGKLYSTHNPEFNITFNTYRYKSRLISFKFNIYEIIPGQEVEYMVETMTFDLNTEKQILLKDLFIEKNYINILSEKANYYFTHDLYWNNLSFLKDGLKATQDNFKQFILNDEYLELIFNQKESVNRVLGIPTYKIPIAELKPYMNNELLVDIVREQEIDIAKVKKAPTPEVSLEELKDKKLIALTYDDGPHKVYTPKLLDILQEADAKATFFILGSRAEYNPEILQRIVSEGHQIGNHSFTHRQFITLSSNELQTEVQETNNIIEEITGVIPTVTRTPYGEVTKKIRESINMPIILWNIDSLDWKTKSSDRVYNNIISKVQDGDIILMHDIFPVCVEGTKKLITKLKEDGYVFVTVETLILVKNGEIKNNREYKYVR